jgi:hypothetical protein
MIELHLFSFSKHKAILASRLHKAASSRPEGRSETQQALNCCKNVVGGNTADKGSGMRAMTTGTIAATHGTLKLPRNQWNMA